MKPRVREAIICEGRYDKNAISQVVDATIIETRGFGIFSDGETLALLGRIAEKRGIIVLTDSDGAGFVIRNRIKGALDKSMVKHAYIPDVAGTERRKRRPSAEGKLGVEGMEPEVILESLRRAGATFEDSSAAGTLGEITMADLFELGLSGGSGSRERRRLLKNKLGLPEHLSTGALLDVLSALMTREELAELVK